MAHNEERRGGPAGPLEGVRVVELATVIMGPYASMQLADLGAEVVKVEAPEGDPTRYFAPHRHPGMSGVTLTINRNKRSVVLDLKSAGGHAAFLALLREADVLVTNMRPAALSRLGIGYTDVAETCPQLVYAQAAGFRSTSDRADAAAYDDIVQAASGMVWLNERLTDSPTYAPTVIADKVCGLVIAQSVLAALLWRQRTGAGQHVEVPMVDAMLAFNLVEHLTGAAFAPTVEPGYGYGRVLSRQRLACRTADGSMCVLPYSDRNWRDFFAFADRPELADDPRFATMADRVAHADELYATLAELTPAFTTAELQEFCDRASIPAHRVESLRTAVESEYATTGLVEQRTHPTEGDYRYVRPAVRFSATPLHLRRHAPRLGEHTDEVLDTLASPTSESDQR